MLDKNIQQSNDNWRFESIRTLSLSLLAFGICTFAAEEFILLQAQWSRRFRN